MENLGKTFLIMFKYARRTTIFNMFFMLLTGIIPTVVLYFTQMLLNNMVLYVYKEGSMMNIAVDCGIILFGMFILATSTFFNSFLYVGMQRQLNRYMNPVLLKKFMSVEYQYFEDSDMHDTIKCMSDKPQENILQLFVKTTDLLSKSISLLGSILLFAQAKWWYVPGFLILLVPMLWCDYKATKAMNDLFEHQSMDQREMDYLGGLLSEKDSNFELKVFHAVPYIMDKWLQKSRLVLKERIDKTIHGHKYYFLSIPLYKVWMIIIIVDMTKAVANGRLSLGIFSVLVMSLGTLLSNSDVLSHDFQDVSRRAQLMKFFDHFMKLPEIKDNGNRDEILDSQLSIRFENVDFTYPKTKNKILDNVSFEIKTNQKVALVGENGAGKSTIIKLLCRLYRPDKGRILINGRDLNDYNQDHINKMFSILFQDYGRYSASLRENIAFGNIGEISNDKKIVEALNVCYGADINQNIDANLGKMEGDGVDLSGGQWQRVALARAYLSDAGFRILDEPTSALDPIIESKLYQTFSEIIKERGCLIVSHRLPSARMADFILVMQNGRIVEQGTHNNLLEKQGLYDLMWKEQSQWYKGDEVYE